MRIYYLFTDLYRHIKAYLFDVDYPNTLRRIFKLK